MSCFQVERLFRRCIQEWMSIPFVGVPLPFIHGPYRHPKPSSLIACGTPVGTWVTSLMYGSINMTPDQEVTLVRLSVHRSARIDLGTGPWSFPSLKMKHYVRKCTTNNYGIYKHSQHPSQPPRTYLSKIPDREWLDLRLVPLLEAQ